MITELLQHPGSEIVEGPLDFYDTLTRNKIQLEVAEELQISKEKLTDWMLENSLKMREIMNQPDFQKAAASGDWDGAKLVLVNNLDLKKAA